MHYTRQQNDFPEHRRAFRRCSKDLCCMDKKKAIPVGMTFPFLVAEKGFGLCLNVRFSTIGSAARFAVPGVRLAGGAAALHTDRCTALPSLFPPLAAVGSLTQRATLVGLITRRLLQFLSRTKENTTRAGGVFFGCGGRTRTYDLRVMSPTSFQLLYSAMFRRTFSAWVLYHSATALSRAFLSTAIDENSPEGCLRGRNAAIKMRTFR